jgi:signal transduction histidine kinase/CheY-like chemotaxis protein
LPHSSEVTLVLAPIGRDAAAIVQQLRSAQLDSEVCERLEDLVQRLPSGAGAAIIAEEALIRTDLSALSNWVAAQPSWSDFPFLVLTSSHTTRPEYRARRSLIEMLGNVSLLARPLSAISLISAVQASLHARRRQYEVRQHLEIQQRNAEHLEYLVNERTHQLLETNRRLRAEMAERKQAETALQQAQKMEVIGQMTGGIAHDFNNLLTAVIGNVDLAQRRSQDERVARLLDGALKAARRGAKLTSQLLAFARKQRLSVEPTDLNALVAGMGDLLIRSVGTAVRVETRLAEGLWPAMIDPSQTELMILNLALNARDAMPDGGIITLQTTNSPQADQDRPHSLDLAGEYVALSVADSGSGMSDDVVAKVFEPFFTTKPAGAGTGLGLSQVYGVTRQMGGQVNVQTAVGAGTTFTLYLPRAAGTPESLRTEEHKVVDLARKSARVLVVDDDDDVRDFTVSCLETLGYEVLEAASGRAAYKILQQHRHIDLLIVDVIMPEIKGPEVARQALAMQPSARVLLMSGYVAEPDRTPLEFDVLAKPFTVGDLGAKVEEMLRREPAPANVTRLYPQGRQS